MRVLVFIALFLALTLNCQACHIQNYDGPIYVAPHCGKDKNIKHISNNNVATTTTCDNDCDCVNKQLSGCVPINNSPQNSGTCYHCGPNSNKFGNSYNNNNFGTTTTSCSSTNWNNCGGEDAITIYIYDESDKNCGCGSNGCGTCWNNAGTTCNNDRTTCNNDRTTYNNDRTTNNNVGTTYNNDGITGNNMGTNYNHYYVPLYTKVGVPTATTYGYGNVKKNPSCPKCGCSIAN